MTWVTALGADLFISLALYGGIFDSHEPQASPGGAGAFRRVFDDCDAADGRGESGGGSVGAFGGIDRDVGTVRDLRGGLGDSFMAAGYLARVDGETLLCLVHDQRHFGIVANGGWGPGLSYGTLPTGGDASQRRAGWLVDRARALAGRAR